MNVLIVENDTTAVERLKEFVEKFGYIPTVCYDGRNVLNNFKDFDIIILDWTLPDISGLELIREIRKTHPDYPPYIIMVTSCASYEEHQTALETGANSFLSKPIIDAVKLQAHLDFACKSVLKLREEQTSSRRDNG
jgi:DNA-binding response OmpR family regulator